MDPYYDRGFVVVQHNLALEVKKSSNEAIFNRPGVAGAVLHTASSLIQSVSE